jgi:hypothetical protein
VEEEVPEVNTVNNLSEKQYDSPYTMRRRYRR